MLIGLSTVLLVGWLVDMLKPMSTPSPAAMKEPPLQMVGFYENQTRGAPHPGSWPAKELAHRYGVAIHYSSSESQNFFTYKANGVSHIVYFMGDRSARARIALAQSRHLGGVSLWRLGYQDTAFWQKAP